MFLQRPLEHDQKRRGLHANSEAGGERQRLRAVFLTSSARGKTICERAPFGMVAAARSLFHACVCQSRRAKAQNALFSLPGALRCGECAMLSVRYPLSPKLPREVCHRTRSLLPAMWNALQKGKRPWRIPRSSAKVPRAIRSATQANSITDLGHRHSMRQLRC